MLVVHASTLNKTYLFIYLFIHNKVRALLQKIGSRMMLPSIIVSSRFENYPKTLNYRKTVKSSSISLLVFMCRKGISQLWECDDCASFMSKYSTRNASRIYIVEPSEVRSSHHDVTGS